MKIVDTKLDSGTPLRVRVNRTGRRTYSREYKLEVVQECSAQRTSVAAVAMSHRINANLVRRWMVQHRAGRLGVAPLMLPVTVSPGGLPATSLPPSVPCSSAAGVIELELAGAYVRVRGVVDEAALRTVLEMLVKR